MSNPHIQQAYNLRVLVAQFVDQVVDSDLLLQIGMVQQRQRVLVHLIQGATATTRLERADVIERAADVLQHRHGHVLAPQPQLTHGVKVRGLILVGSSLVRQLKKRVVRLVEKTRQYRLQ